MQPFALVSTFLVSNYQTKFIHCRFDTLNIYEGENFAGLEKFTYNDKPSFSEGTFGKSIIITGCSPWTIYE